MISASHSALAHFPFLVTDDQQQPVLFFGEGLSDRTYHLPESLKTFPVQVQGGEESPGEIQWQAVDEEHLVGLRAGQSVAPGSLLVGSKPYGVYHGSKLVYYAQHFTGERPAAWPEPADSLPLRATLKPGDEALTVHVAWQDGPLVDAKVQLFDRAGETLAEVKTDKQGAAALPLEKLVDGQHALLVGFTDADSRGDYQGEAFDSASHYLSVTFNWPAAVRVGRSDLPDLPTELTSFGGAIAGDHLYLYGGHIGEAHSYSTAEQSDALWALDLAQGGDAQWRELANGPRLQGLAMVAHGDNLVRLGGFTAKNAEGDEHDLHSQATVSRFDAAVNRWTDLTPLPEPRSSFNATVLGDRLYVVGGWNMAGDQETQWHTTAWSADLGEDKLTWEPLAKPPFVRRALSVAAHNGKVYAVGGMQQEGGVSTRTDIYDPKTDSWQQGPDLVGESMAGFGCWAQSLGGRLYVSTVEGTVQRLDEQAGRWEVVGTYYPGRFFHCMLPADEQTMLMVGGANMSIGRFTEIEKVVVED
ncbi:kelch repeat-containing protein [Roseimaritima sediminicola]|uniref:kelch repeat-containing protein n=1 Tax=Roseimaritima sediminicola TaxID=2662066 RepID=UPI001386D864|nr:kelch repeat-containing protein [Roseimaritima sediminicola]